MIDQFVHFSVLRGDLIKLLLTLRLNDAYYDLDGIAQVVAMASH